MPVEFNIEDAKVENIFNENAYSMFKQYEFKSMLNRFDTDKVSQKHIASYNIVKDITNANEILAEINPFEYCGYKLITENSIIKGIAITQKENH